MENYVRFNKGGREMMITMYGNSGLNKTKYTTNNNGLRIGIKISL